MTKLSLNLFGNRLIFSFSKRRIEDIQEPIFPSLKNLKRVKNGSKFSRFFRHIFERIDVKKVLGANLTFMVLATSLISFNPLEAKVPDEIVNETPVPLSTERAIQYPTDPVRITQKFNFFHPGIDLDGITGDTIKPIKAGIVEAISRSKFAYGNAIIINHGNGLTSLYAHLSKILVTEGEEVTTLTKIGEMGATGHAFGDHLHLEIRDNGRPINPLSVLPLP